MSDKQATVTFQLPETLREQIKAMAAFEDRSEASMIRRLLGDALIHEANQPTTEGAQ